MFNMKTGPVNMASHNSHYYYYYDDDYSIQTGGRRKASWYLE